MVDLQDEQWSRLYQFLREEPSVYAGQEHECRLFIEAVRWIVRTGARWRELPEPYGKWNSVYKRYANWCEKGIWDRMREYFGDDPMIASMLTEIDPPHTQPYLRRSNGRPLGLHG